MKKLILFIVISYSAFADMQFVNPQPSFENPRKWVIKLRNSDLEKVNHMLGSIYNVLQEYPTGGIKISVIAYAQGMRVLKKDYDPYTLSRISSLMDYDVEFIGCINTMTTMKWKKSDFIDEISFVKAGIVEIIERQAAGWIETTPY